MDDKVAGIGIGVVSILIISLFMIFPPPQTEPAVSSSNESGEVVFTNNIFTEIILANGKMGDIGYSKDIVCPYLNGEYGDCFVFQKLKDVKVIKCSDGLLAVMNTSEFIGCTQRRGDVKVE